jgi:hypothetical protein
MADFIRYVCVADGGFQVCTLRVSEPMGLGVTRWWWSDNGTAIARQQG